MWVYNPTVNRNLAHGLVICASEYMIIECDLTPVRIFLLHAIVNMLFCLCGIYVFSRHINIISINQELMFSVQIQSFLIFFDLADGIL